MRIFLGIGVVAAVIMAVVNLAFYIADPAGNIDNLSAVFISALGAFYAGLMLMLATTKR